MNVTRRTFIKLSAAAALWASSLPRFANAAGAGMPDVRIPVLLYHDIASFDQDDYMISPSSFAAQMEWLYANGYKTLFLNEVGESLKSDDRRTVIITFDDGNTSFMDYAFPLLKAYGFKATMNIIGQAVDLHLLLDDEKPVVSWDECRYLIRSGLVDLGCHSFALHTPGGVRAVSYDALEKDLIYFQEKFSKEIGRPCSIIAWPYGIYDETCAAIAKKAGFTYILTSDEGYVGKETNPSQFPRLNINGKLDLESFQQYIGAVR